MSSTDMSTRLWDGQDKLAGCRHAEENDRNESDVITCLEDKYFLII